MKIENIENILSEEEYSKIVKKKLSKDGIVNYSVLKKEIIPLGGQTGYMGQYFTLKATVAESPTDQCTRIIKFFAKIPPPLGTPQYEFGMEMGTFKKEIDIYKKCFPRVIRDLDKLDYIPECFFGIDGNVIVLDDKTADGYTMPDKSKPFDINHCTLIIKTMAKFHANSIIYEETTKKNIYNEFSYCLQEALWPLRNSGRGNKNFEAALKGTESLIDLIDCLDDKSRAIFKAKFIKLSGKHCQKLQPSNKFRNVVVHGDLWSNNLLFKYDKNDEPTHCVLLDFQLARYHAPAHDIWTLLYFTTTKKFRDEHAANLMKIYHKTMSEALDEAGLNPAEVFPDFFDSIEHYRLHSAMHGLLNSQVMLLDPEVASKYFKKQPELLEMVLYTDRSPLVSSQFQEVEEYRERIRDLILEVHSLSKQIE